MPAFSAFLHEKCDALMHHCDVCFAALRMWQKIIKLLKDAGFSQQMLAEKAGVDQSTICRIGDGRAPEPRYSVGVTLIELAGGEDGLRQHGIDSRAFVGSVVTAPLASPAPEPNLAAEQGA